MAQERDNVKAGAFVLAAIVLAMVVVFTLSDFKRLFEKRQKIEVYYGLSDGLQGLKIGAVVTLGDQPIGAVVNIRDFTQEEKNRLFPSTTQPAKEPAIATGEEVKQPGSTTQPASKPLNSVVGKIVTISIPKHYVIYQDAVIELNVPPLGSGTKLNIRNVGYDTDNGEDNRNKETDNKPYDGSKPIIGGVAGSQLARNFINEAGIGDLQKEQIRVMIDNLADLSAALTNNSLPPRHQIKPDDHRAAELREALLKLPALLTDARQALAQAQAALANVKTITDDVRQRSPAWFNHIDGITASADDSLKRVDTLVKDKDPDLRKVIDNVRDISQTAKDKTMVQVTDALDKANDAMGNLKKTTEELKAFVVGQRPVLERMLANFELSSDQLKLAAIEVRRSPWRLLYKPGDEELTTDNLYDAARSFALAAGTLDAASRSLSAVANQAPQDKEQVQKMLDHLQTLFKKYEEAEDAFWKALKGQKP